MSSGKNVTPNILLAIADDQSWPHASAYGCDFVNTPAFDRVVREGVLFTHAYCPAPQCSPSRAGLLTGRNIWQLEEAGVHGGLFPAKFPVYTERLQDAGYHIGYTCKGWAPGNWQLAGRTMNPAGKEYNRRKHKPPTRGIHPCDYVANFRDFLQDRDPGQPFCFWFGCKEPHRPYEPGEGRRFGKNLDDVEVPPYLPDCEEVRSDLLDYAFEVEWYDRNLGEMLQIVEAMGELENTLVLVTSDNGMPFPRAKANLYEHGTHMPLAIRWGGAIPGGRVIDDFVSFTDLAPTFLEAAGLTPPQMTGRSLLSMLASHGAGRIEPDRDAVVTGRERHAYARAGNTCYPIRAIRTHEFLYMRNFTPDRWPAGDPEAFADIDDSPSKSYILDHRRDEAVRRYFELACAKRPPEELYDMRRDPGCLENVCEQPSYAAIRESLSNRLQAILTDQRDPRILGQGDVFETYPYYLRDAERRRQREAKGDLDK